MIPTETSGTPNKAGNAPVSVADSQRLHSSLLAMAQANGDAASNGPPGLSATPTLSGLLQAVRRRWLLAVTLALTLGISTVLAVFTFHPPQYNVNLRIRVIARLAGAEDVEFPIFKANMEAMVRNPIVLSNALNDKASDGREIKDLELVRSKGMGAIDWLEKKLKTDYLLGPEVLRVTLASDMPEDAAELMNAINRAFLNEYMEMERSKKQLRTAELRSKKEAIERELNTLRAQLARQLESLDVKDQQAANVQQGVWLSKLSAAEATKRSIDEDIAKAETEIFTGNANLKIIDSLEVPDDVLFDFYTKDQILTEMNKRLSELDRDIAECYRKYNEPFASREATPLKHEKIKINNQRELREARLKPEIEQRYRKRVADDLKFQVKLAEQKVQAGIPRREKELKSIQELMRKVQEAGIGNLNEPPQIQATRQNIESARTSLNQTVQKIGEVELEPLVSRVVPLQGASVPLEKDRSQQTKLGGAGGLAVFLLTLFGVGFYEFRSRKISVADEVATGLGIHVIGTIPALPTSSRLPSVKDQLLAQSWQGELQEAVDAIRTVILHKARTDALHVLMVTSAQSGEGKTTLASQLASSLARAWKRTLIIDADLRHPGIHTLFDSPQEPGLAEVLRGEVEPTDAIRATPVSRLWVLPAGNGDGHAIQALAQDNVRSLFELLKQQYDFIIIDSPPVLPVADSLLVGQHVDGVLFAILREVSRAPAVYAAQQKLAPLEVHTLGAVVLGAEKEFNDKAYGYVMNPGSK